MKCMSCARRKYCHYMYQVLKCPYYVPSGASNKSRAEAFKVISEIRGKLLETYGPTDYDSAEEIRRWRDARD